MLESFDKKLADHGDRLADVGKQMQRHRNHLGQAQDQLKLLPPAGERERKRDLVGRDVGWTRGEDAPRRRDAAGWQV